LQRLLQQEADALKLGVKIVFVGVQDIHPPVKVAKSFEDVIGAGQDNQAKLRNAKDMRPGRCPWPMPTRTGWCANPKLIARGRSPGFGSGSSVYQSDRSLQRLTRRFRPTFLSGDPEPRSSTNSPKFFLGATNADEVLILNLEQKVRTEILDYQFPAKK